nr:hypothetical protein [Tanacetum cinerariifolium]
MQQPILNPKDITDPTTAMNMAFALTEKAFKLNYSTPTNNNQRISSNPRKRQIAQPECRESEWVQRGTECQESGNGNQTGHGNLVVAHAEGNAVGHNDGSAEVHDYENYDDNEIFNMFTQEEQYTELLKPIPEQHQVPQNDNNFIFEVTSVEQGRETVEQHPINFEETRALYDSLYHNLVIEVEKVNSVNRKLKETNADLTTKLARFKNQEKCFEISQEKYDKLKRCYQQSVYQEQCLYKKINALHSSTAKSREEFSFSNDSKTANVSKSISIPIEEFLDDTTPSVARKFLNEVKSTIVTLQRVVKHRMTLETHNWSSSAHQELHKIVKDEILPMVNQVDARVQNFGIQFLKEASKFVGDFKSLAKEADESLAKQKALEVEIKHLLRAVVIKWYQMANLQQASTSGTQTDRAFVYDSDGSTEVHENCDDNEIFNMFTQEEQYSELLEPIPESHQVLQNDNNVIFEDTSVEQGGETVEQHPENFEGTRTLYDSLYQNLAIEVEKVNSVNRTMSFQKDKAYKDMQQNIERLQAQLGDLKGKSKDTSCVSDTQNPLSQKLENENVELEFQVLNYARENAHLKATYKNLFYSISVSRTQTKTIISSLQNELQSTIYKNAKLKTQLFKKVSDQKDNTYDTSKNTKFAKQSILGKPPMLDKIHALSKPVTSNSVSTPQEPKVMKNDKVIALGIFRINPDKDSREEKHVPNTVSSSAETKPITISQPLVFTKKDVNSDLNGLSSTGLDNPKTKRP